MPITIKNSAGGGVTLDSSTSSNETINLNTPVFTGNVGIGVVPEATRTSDTVLALGATSRHFVTSSNHDVRQNNARLDASGNPLYITTNPATRYQHLNTGVHTFDVAPSGSADAAISWTTAMTIDNSGKVMVAAASAGGKGLTFYPAGSSGNMYVLINKDVTSASTCVSFQVNSSQVGSISYSSSGTSYNTSSDYRLKTDVQPMTGATDRVKLLKPCNFEWISDGTRVDGFLAHEAQEVVPEAVHGTKDAMMDEEYEVTAATDTEAAVMGTRSVPDMQGIDQSKLVPLLTATIQELIARIEALENN